MSDGCCAAGGEQCTGHERYKELVNEHYKEPVNGLFDVTTSVLKALVPDEPESDVEVNIGK